MEIWTADHSALLQEGRTAVRQQSTEQAEEALAATISGAPVQGARQLRRVKNTGAWLMVHSSKVNGKELGSQ